MRPLYALSLVLLGCVPCARAQDFDTTTHVAANPQNAAVQAANDALAAHDFPLAVKLLQPLAAARPRDAGIAYDLGSAYDALDQAAAAEASYRAAIADDASLAAPHVALGLLLARAGKFAEARSELVIATGSQETGSQAPARPETSAQSDALRARAFRTLARLDEKTRPEDARNELLAALKLSPETPDDTLLAAELAAAAGGGAAPAEAEYRRVLAARPNDPQAAAALGHLLLTQKRLPEAEKLETDALAAHPDDPALTTGLASLYHAQGKDALALPLLGALHRANPGDADITHLLATLELESKDYAAAEPLLAQLAAAQPADASLVTDRADALIHLKRYAEAEAILERVVAQSTLFARPQDLGEAAGALAFACSENNDPAGALRALGVRATVLPPTGITLFLAAISEDKLHHVKLAIKAYHDFLAVSAGALPDQEFEAQHRIVALEHMK